MRISVSDHGPGVADSELDAIFQPFYRSPSNPTGTGYGLGLAIARRAVEKSRRAIVARNRPEGGLRVGDPAADPSCRAALMAGDGWCGAHFGGHVHAVTFRHASLTDRIQGSG